MCTALPALQSLVVDFVAVDFLPLEKEAPAPSWKLYMYIPQSKLQFMICCNVRLMYYSGTPNLNRPHTPKRIIVRYGPLSVSLKRKLPFLAGKKQESGVIRFTCERLNADWGSQVRKLYNSKSKRGGVGFSRKRVGIDLLV